MADLLYEIGTEEMPAGYLEPALRQLAEGLGRLLAADRLAADSVRTAGTPRRLTVWFGGIPRSQPPLEEEVIGPPARVAFDGQGRPTQAALGFAGSQNIGVEDLVVRETEKGPYIVARKQTPGQSALEVLPAALQQAVRAIVFPKSMRWTSGGLEFARPIRWLLALFGEDVVKLSLDGVEAGRVTYGHPFLARHARTLEDASFERYVATLREAFVLVDVEERKAKIRSQIEAKLQAHGTRLSDEELLDEVTNLVEYPYALEGSFDEEFLVLPPNVLTAAMKEHQRYFPVRNAEGTLQPRFITVSNRTADQEKTVREGNERVLRARLADAKFFWDEDRQTKLEERVPLLKDVVFLGGLGNNLQRTQRLVALSERIAKMMGLADPNVAHIRRAAYLCKADLLTGLVGEFPSLQGQVGRELALHQGEPEPVAEAIAEHYRPAGAGGEMPASPEGTALALADKLDAILGCFSLGLLPSGSQDPYALRRNAQGILQVVEAGGLKLSLEHMLRASCEEYVAAGVDCEEGLAPQILDFFRDRLQHAAIERGSQHDFVQSVLAAGFDDVRDFWVRLDALRQCASRPWWPALVELVDRTFRIQRDLEDIVPVREDLLKEPEEKELGCALQDHRDEVASAFDQERYVEGAEKYCAAFAEKVHIFFDKVFVNVEDEEVRRNRKSLCGEIYRLFGARVADLYLIESA